MSIDGSQRDQKVVSILPLLEAQNSRIRVQPSHTKSVEQCDLTPDVIQGEATAIVDLLVNGQMDEIAARCLFPVAIYVGEKVMILRDLPSLRKALSAYRSILVEAGLVHIESKLTKSECGPSGKSMISVENHYFSNAVDRLGAAKINYYCERQGSFLRICMAEYVEWPLPDKIAQDRSLNSMMH